MERSLCELHVKNFLQMYGFQLMLSVMIYINELNSLGGIFHSLLLIVLHYIVCFKL